FLFHAASTHTHTRSLHALFRSSSASRNRIQSLVASFRAKFFWFEKLSNFRCRNFEACFLAISGVLSVLNESITIISSAKETEKRSEEHTSELQSRENLVCRLLL